MNHVAVTVTVCPALVSCCFCGGASFCVLGADWGPFCAGKYTPDGPRPAGPRGNIYSNKIREIQPLISLLKAVGEERGKSPAQVSDICLS